MGLSLEQLELRRTRVGSSEVGALLGIDPYKSAFDVWMEKQLPPKPNGEDHRTWGLDMESAIIPNHLRRNKYDLVIPVDDEGKPTEDGRWPSMPHPSLPIICTPDAIALKDGVLIDVQAKNDQGFGQIEWGEAGTDDAPLLYVAQVVMELGVLRAKNPDKAYSHGELAVSIRGGEPQGFRIEFNPELFGDLGEICAKWKRDHLDTGKPPEGSPMEVAEYIKRKYVKHTGDLIEPTAELAAMVQLVGTMRATIKGAKEDLVAAENAVKERIGEAMGIAGLCTWKSQTKKAHVVKESTSRVLRLIGTKGED